MVDLTRDEHGRLHARLLDVVPGRSGTAYAAWLKAQPRRVHSPGSSTPRSTRSAATPTRIRDELPDAVAVLDAFHVVRLGTQVVDEVRRRVQQDTLGRRGHKRRPALQDPRAAAPRRRDTSADASSARLDTGLRAGDPNWRGHLAWHGYQQLRSIYRAKPPAEGRRIAEQVIAAFPTCPIPEVARLGRTLRAVATAQSWPTSTPSGVSNGGTEADQPASSRRPDAWPTASATSSNYRLRILLIADGTRPYRRS